MAEPISWQALQSLRTLLERITVANDFYTDLGLGEFCTDRSRFKLESSAVTLIVANEIIDDADNSGPRTKVSEMPVTIEYSIPFTVENAELIAHRGAADIRRALSGDLRGLPYRFRFIDLDGVVFGSDAYENAIPFTVAQVNARAGLTDTYSPAT